MEKIRDVILGIDLGSFLKELRVSNLQILEEATRYFEEKEAVARSEILKGYFGDEGINTIIENTAKELKVLRQGSNVLDIGAGTGFFTIAINRELGKGFNFYAMDPTRAMLLAGLKDMQRHRIVPFLGTAEKIKESIELSNSCYERVDIRIPSIYQGIVSILTLHHCEDIEKVFRSVHSVMDRGASCIIIDLCEHPFTEFKQKMADLHLGFNLDCLKEKAAKVFREVKIKRLPGIECKESGRAAELFIASVKTF